MAGVKDVSGTAFVVAEFRAEENHQPRPLYRDPVVEMFLDEDTRHADVSLIVDAVEVQIAKHTSRHAIPC